MEDVLQRRRHQLEEIFNPTSIAIVGASGKDRSPGYFFLHHLLDYGYGGEIYPINPNLQEVMGLKVYSSIKEIPAPVDYVICCVPAPKVVKLIEDSKEKGVKCIHLFTGRLSETGREEGVKLEEEILQKAKDYGLHLIGPNCVGIYYPKKGISFNYGFPKEAGVVGAMLQSGGASTELVRYASLRGIRFSKVVSYGNAVDLNEVDFLNYFLHDPETKVIAMYIEGTRNGKYFFNALRKVTRLKPVIVLKAGRGGAGSRAAVSHTASLTGSSKTWETAIAQAGAINVHSLDEMIDLILAFYFLPPFCGNRVGIAGGGGGRSVLSADVWEEAGFDIIPLPVEIRKEVKNKQPEVWDLIRNPADRSVGLELVVDTGEVLKMMEKSPHFDLLAANVTDDSPFGKEQWQEVIRKEAKDFIEIGKRGLKPLIVVLKAAELGIVELDDWRWRFLAEQRSQLVSAGVPVYSSSERAVKAIGSFIKYNVSQKEVSKCQE